MYNVKKQFLQVNFISAASIHGNQFSKIINSEMVILTPITINNHFNNANYVTKVDHLCLERHTFNFLLKKVDFRELAGARFDKGVGL